MIFFDASALAKAYLDEAGTTNVDGVFERMAGLLFVSEFVALEVFTTLRGAFRTTPAARYNEAVERFKQDYAVRLSRWTWMRLSANPPSSLRSGVDKLAPEAWTFCTWRRPCNSRIRLVPAASSSP